MTPTAPARMPSTFTLAVADLLVRRDQRAVLPGVLALLAPNITAHPRPASDPGPQLVDLAFVRRLVVLLAQHRALPVLVALLDLTGPYLAAPLPPVEPAPTPTVVDALDEQHKPLTDREREVLAGMSDGRTNGEIGRSLHLSEDTVKTHARRLFRKIGARDRAHAVRRGFELGYLALPDREPADVRTGRGRTVVAVAS